MRTSELPANQFGSTVRILYSPKMSRLAAKYHYPGTPAKSGLPADSTPLDIVFSHRYLPPHQSSRVMLDVDVVAGHTK
jgi:hypothetical protein